MLARISISTIAAILPMILATTVQGQIVQANLMTSGSGRLTGSGYVLFSTLGQTTAGVTSGSSYSEKAGFWYALDQRMEATNAEEALDDFIPLSFSLGNVYPNPTDRISTLVFDLPEPSRVRIEVFDIRGRLVELPLDSVKPAGRHRISLSASSWSSGTYVVRLTAQDFGGNRLVQVIH